MAEKQDALGPVLGDSAALLAGFREELERTNETLSRSGGEMARFERDLTRHVERAVDGVLREGQSLGSALRGIAKGAVAQRYDAAMNPVSKQVSRVISGGLGALTQRLFPFAEGAAFSGGRPMPFAKGGVVRGPVQFPMRGGTGLMGEAGPEAILPLRRGPDGRLGVDAGGGAAPLTVHIHVTSPDAGSFRKSQSRIAAELARTLDHSMRHR